jgi:imidazolonepropionase-like amidohydrolase
MGSDTSAHRASAEGASARGQSATDAAAPRAEEHGATGRIALLHVTVIDPRDGSAQPDRTVVVDGDVIAAVVPSGGPLPASGAGATVPRIVDAQGKFIVPGLWDMHVHFADPGSAKLFIANGVTGVRVMWGNPRFAPGMERFHFEMREAFDKGAEVGPRMVIASQILDGPTPIWPNSVALSTPAEGRKAVSEAKAEGSDFIKVYSLLPRPVYAAIADESKKWGLPFAGHVPESMSVAEASDMGQRSIEHLTGMLVACSSRETELRRKQAAYAKKERTPAEWSAYRREQVDQAIATYDAKHAGSLFAKFVKNGTWHCPTLTVENVMASLDDPSLGDDPRLAYVTSMTRRQWDPKEDFRTKNRTAADYAAMRTVFQRKLALVGAMNAANVPLLAGTDELNPYCFAGFSLHDELVWLTKAGLTAVEALRAATWSPARYLGREATMGTVAPGKVADLVVLDADPRADVANTRKIAAVVTRGRYFDRAALDALLVEVKAAAADDP